MAKALPGFTAGLTILLLAAAAPLAAAHEHVKVGDGKYELTVGWRVEPAYVGQVNGLDLKVSRLAPADHVGDHASGDHAHAPAADVVENAHKNLTITYEYGGKTFTPINFRPKFGQAGWYTAEITPTREGKYKVHIAGTIEGTPVNVTVEPHEVTAVSEVSFPEKDPSSEQLGAENAKLKADVQALQAKVQALEAGAKTAPAGGIVGALAALSLGAVVLLRKRR